MQRLLKDAEKISGIKYDISSFSDVTEAIHVMQESMGIAGTTAREAATTIEGSISMMKGAWQNLVVGMADSEADMEVLINNFVESAGIAAQNLIPRIEQTLAGIGQLIEKMAPIIADALPKVVEALLPTIITAGITLITALANALVTALPAVKDALIEGLAIILTDVFGVSEDKARGFVDGLNSAFDKVSDGFRSLVESAQTEGTFLNKVWTKLTDAVDVARDGFAQFMEFCSGLLEKLQPLVPLIGDYLKTAWTKLTDAVDVARDVFIQVVDFAGRLWDNLQPLIGLIGDNLMAAFEGLKEPLISIKGSFGELWEVITTKLIPMFGGALAGAVGVAIGLFNGIVSAVSGFADAVAGAVQIVTGTIQAIVGVFTDDGEMIQKAADNIGEGVIAVFGGLWDACKGFVSGFVDGVVGFFTALWDTLVGHSIVPDTINGIANCFGELWGKVSGSVKKFVSNVVDNFNKLWKTVKEATQKFLETAKSVISNGLTKAKETISNILSAVKDKFVTIWDNCKSTVSNAVDNVKSAISAGMETAKSTVSSVLDGIKSKFTSIWDNCLSIVKNAVTALKNALNFSWSLPKLKLPHISVTGGVAPYGIGGKGSLPKFSIEWYKKAYDNAMILNSPTIFGYSAASGKFLGGGDGNGNEIVAGESYLMNLIGKVVAEQNGQLAELLNALLEATVDGNGEMVRALKAGQVITLNERELGRTVRGLV